MKFLVLLFLVGCASSASLYNALDDAAEERDLLLGLESDLYLKEALGLFDDDLYGDGDDVTSELKKQMDKMLEKIKDWVQTYIDKGKEIGQFWQNKLKEILEKFQEKNIEISEKVKEFLKKYREKFNDKLKEIIDKVTKEGEGSELEEELADFNLKDLFKKLRDSLLDNIDKEKLKEKIENLFGKGNKMAERLLEILKEKGDKYKQKLLDLVDRYLGKKEERSISDYWEKVKNYFKDLHIELKEKYFKFGEFVKEKLSKYLDNGKDKLANIKAIAKEFIDHAKGVSKDVANEALEFLRPYKDDLGSLWNQLKDTVKDIMNKKD